MVPPLLGHSCLCWRPGLVTVPHRCPLLSHSHRERKRAAVVPGGPRATPQRSGSRGDGTGSQRPRGTGWGGRPLGPCPVGTRQLWLAHLVTALTPEPLPHLGDTVGRGVLCSGEPLITMNGDRPGASLRWRSPLLWGPSLVPPWAHYAAGDPGPGVHLPGQGRGDMTAPASGARDPVSVHRDLTLGLVASVAFGGFSGRSARSGFPSIFPPPRHIPRRWPRVLDVGRATGSLVAQGIRSSRACDREASSGHLSAPGRPSLGEISGKGPAPGASSESVGPPNCQRTFQKL